MIRSIVSPPLAIASGAFNFDPATTTYLVSAAFITTGIATALQVTRLHIMKTPFFVGTGLLSVVGPTFDILLIVFNYSALRYNSGNCPVLADGTQGPCPDAWGACLGTMLCCVWLQIALAFVPPKMLNMVFPKLITGSLLTLVGIYLIGFSVFATIILVEALGAPLMRSASIIIGLAVGCAISGAAGQRRSSTKRLMAVLCIPDILATAELSNVDIEGTEFISRIQGGILCDGIGNFFSALATGPPMVSQAGNDGVIVLTGCASRRAGWAASGFLVLMGIIAKFGAVFASMPPSVLGGMQVFLYSSITVAGVRVLALIPWTRRDCFILTVALGVGFMDICQPDWFAQVLAYNGPNQNLVGFEQGINLAGETPFVFAAIVGVFLNAVLPKDRGAMSTIGYGDERKHPRIGERED
ncbi:hypothetical protein PTNB29_06634 [Pyrenophora teres f. teres]|nr:hypothetical protein PTNB29_06634 [Pyrenophora teres f. teres]